MSLSLTQEFIDSLSVNTDDLISRISTALNLPLRGTEAVVRLLKEGNTIPFISRYRKEATGSLDEVQVRDISHTLINLENLEERRIEVIKAIFAQGKLTDEIYINIQKCTTYTELEDLYAPYKQKKKTRGMKAIERGLEPLADLICTQKDVSAEIAKFINPDNEVMNEKDAVAGAMDIIAERIAHDTDNRKRIKQAILDEGRIVIKGNKDADTSVYKMYYDYDEPLKTLKEHRVLAINRGENEGELDVKIDYDEDVINDTVLDRTRVMNEFHQSGIIDGLRRLLIPAVIREIRSDFTEAADKHGIGVFAENLKNLLMTPPIKKTRILGIDPGIRTGSKAVCISETGKYLDHFMIYAERKSEAKLKIAEYAKKYNAQLIAVGNGTGSVEIQECVSEAITEYKLGLEYTVVSEDGASVYSASDIAREEFPDLDLTIRGAISIARRLQDPLAELVKIDPKSIGVGLYQHDVNQTALSDSLDEVVESVVNNVGVNVNTASFSLLKYVSGITTFTAKNIVEYRDDHGLIRSREELHDIPGIGDKVFQQAAGFIKIPESDNPLDNTWVHPENYEIASVIYDSLKKNVEFKDKDILDMERKYDVSDTVIRDIIDEIKKPNRDPRDGFPKPIMQKGVVKFEDLSVGMKVTGKVKNVVDFGAFVDIGIKETALIHVSQMSNSYIKSPSEVLKVGDVKEFKIIEIDPARNRISLSLKDGKGASASSSGPRKPKFNYRDYIVETIE